MGKAGKNAPPTGPAAAERYRPHAGLLIISLLAWFLLGGLLFLGFGWVCHQVGDPVQVPGWVADIARLGGTGHGPAVFLSFLFLAVWILVVGGVSWAAGTGLHRLLLKLGAGLGLPKERAEHNARAAFYSLLPVLCICLLTLLVLPAEAPRAPQPGPTEAQLAQYMSFPGFLRLIITGTVAMLALASIFITIGAVYTVAGWLQRGREPGGGVLFGGIFLGILVAMTVGLGGGSVLRALEKHTSAFAELWIVLGAYSVFSALLTLPARLKAPKKLPG